MTLEKITATVLLVEDHADIREIMALELGVFGYEVIVAADGREALDQLETREGGVDVVLTDLTMPRCDGFTLLRNLRAHERWRAIPVIVMTASSVSATEERELVGAVLLRKPVRAGELLTAIRASVKPA